MTQDEIEHMWKVASNDPNHDTNWHDPVVIAFAKLVAEREREACAKISDDADCYSRFVNQFISKRFRARGEQA